MFFWTIYVLSTLLASYLIYLYSPRRVRLITLVFLFVFFITPARIEKESEQLAPAFFIFLFDIIFEQNISTRSLRPLVFSLPGVLLTAFVGFKIKRKFF